MANIYIKDNDAVYKVNRAFIYPDGNKYEVLQQYKKINGTVYKVFDNTNKPEITFTISEYQMDNSAYECELTFHSTTGKPITWSDITGDIGGEPNIYPIPTNEDIVTEFTIFYANKEWGNEFNIPSIDVYDIFEDPEQMRSYAFEADPYGNRISFSDYILFDQTYIGSIC